MHTRVVPLAEGALNWQVDHSSAVSALSLRPAATELLCTRFSFTTQRNEFEARTHTYYTYICIVLQMDFVHLIDEKKRIEIEITNPIRKRKTKSEQILWQRSKAEQEKSKQICFERQLHLFIEIPCGQMKFSSVHLFARNTVFSWTIRQIIRNSYSWWTVHARPPQKYIRAEPFCTDFTWKFECKHTHLRNRSQAKRLRLRYNTSETSTYTSTKKKTEP